MASVTKRGTKWYAMWRRADGRLAQKVTPARTKAEAVLFAQDKERQAWRQREGLEPAPDERFSFGELMDWWWERYGSARRGYANEKFRGFLEKHVGELRAFELRPATAGLFADRLDQLLAERDQAQALSAQSLNHLRAAVFGMFERARDPKHRRWSTENPVRWVKRRKVPKPSRSSRRVLARNEVLQALAGFPEPSPNAPWRWIAATCIYAGLRPGEALGLRKDDVDTRAWILAVRHSWDMPLPKDGDARDVVIVRELRGTSPRRSPRPNRTTRSRVLTVRHTPRTSASDSSTTCAARSSAPASSTATGTSAAGRAAGSRRRAPRRARTAVRGARCGCGCHRCRGSSASTISVTRTRRCSGRRAWTSALCSALSVTRRRRSPRRSTTTATSRTPGGSRAGAHLRRPGEG
jgi:integrase